MLGPRQPAQSGDPQHVLHHFTSLRTGDELEIHTTELYTLNSIAIQILKRQFSQRQGHASNACNNNEQEPDTGPEMLKWDNCIKLFHQTPSSST